MTNQNHCEQHEDEENEVRHSEEDKQKTKSVEETFVESDPDVEDPRLYSPIQEPDRPDPTERASEEKEKSDNPPD